MAAAIGARRRSAGILLMPVACPDAPIFFSLLIGCAA